MNLSYALLQLGDLLNDDESTEYPAATRVRTLDQEARGLFRTQISANKQFHNFTMNLRASSARQLFENVWEWQLPAWVSAVVEVHRRPTSDAADTSISPYVWAAAPLRLDDPIPKNTEGRHPRWTWEGSRVLRLWNESAAPEITLRVAKLPHRQFRAAIATVHTEDDRLYLPPTLEYGEPELEAGAFINAQVQVVSTVDVNAMHIGEIGRVVMSQFVDNGGTRQHELRFQTPFGATLEQGDVVETELPLPDEHCRYLILKAAHVLLQRKANMPGLQSIAGSLSEEAAKFLAYCSPQRDSSGPTAWKPRGSIPRPYNANKAYAP